MNLLDRLFSYHNTKCKTIERLHSRLAGADFKEGQTSCTVLFPPPAPYNDFHQSVFCFVTAKVFLCPALWPSFSKSASAQYMTQLSQSRKCYLLVISDPVPYSQQLPTLLVALHHHCIHHWHFPFPMLSFLGVTMTLPTIIS